MGQALVLDAGFVTDPAPGGPLDQPEIGRPGEGDHHQSIAQHSLALDFEALAEDQQEEDIREESSVEPVCGIVEDVAAALFLDIRTGLNWQIIRWDGLYSTDSFSNAKGDHCSRHYPGADSMKKNGVHYL